MRGIYRFAAIACVVTAGVVAAGSANAQGEVPCRKGILWPFSRQPGDCLTDIEKRNGQTGVYGNANATAPAPQAAPAPAPQAAAAPVQAPAQAPVQAPAQAAAQPESRDGILNLWGLFGSRDAETAAAATPAPASVIAAPAPQAAPVIRAPVVTAAAPITAENCNKGILWPFSRSPGDCLTDVEKRNGQTGVYGNPYGRAQAPAPVAAAPAAPAQAPVTAAAQPESRDSITNLWGLFGSRDTQPVAQAPAPQAAPVAPVAQLPQPAPQYAAPATPVAVQNCTKGMFWPFSRSPGDCLTDVERQNGQTGVYGNPNAVAAAPAPPVQPQPTDSLSRLWSSFGTAPAPAPQVAAPAPAPVVTVENCTKGFLWPFSRETGDCLTDVEKANGQTGVYGNPNAIVRAPAPQAPVAAAPAAPQAPAYAPAPAPQAPAAIANAAPTANAAVVCNKGWFWPFSRKPGDCLTDVEKKNGQTGVYGNPNAIVTAQPPAQLQQAPAAVATYAPAGNGTACNKGWFWPFSRSPGDCLTDTEIRNGQTGVYGNPATVPGAQVVNLAPANSSGGMFGLFGGSNANSNRGLLEDAYAPVVTAAPPPANTFQANAPQVNAGQMNSGQSNAAPAMVASLPPAANANAEAACNKGFFWPFARDPGDCLTDAEKRNGQIGVYRGAEAAAANVAATQVSQPVVNAPAPAAPPAAAAPVAPAAAPAITGEAACTKGWLWPFSRSPGDCLTDVEKKNGQTGVYGSR